jgi:hypothetical protein
VYCEAPAAEPMMSGSGYGARIAPSLIQEHAMPIESSGHSRGNPRLYELVEGAPKTGKSPTVSAWPQLMDYVNFSALKDQACN